MLFSSRKKSEFHSGPGPKKLISPCSILFRSLFFLVLLITINTSESGAIFGDDTRFFSYERFFIDLEVVEAMPSGGKARQDLKLFVSSFMDGLYAISTGAFSDAEKDLIKARETWPEYYGTDFVLALLYEQRGEYALSARCYKTYLKKLKAIYSGNYPISTSIILNFITYNVEPYDGALELVRERVAARGIDIDKVRAITLLPAYFFPLLIFIFFGACYAFYCFRIAPGIKKRRRVKNPPKGYWVCADCGKENALLRKECERCGRRDTENG